MVVVKVFLSIVYCRVVCQRLVDVLPLVAVEHDLVEYNVSECVGCRV